MQPREVFRQALLASATAVVLFHNHPSGDPQPSPEDVDLTLRLARGGRADGGDGRRPRHPRRRQVLQPQGIGAGVRRGGTWRASSTSTASPGPRATWCSAHCSTPDCRRPSWSGRSVALMLPGYTLLCGPGAARGRVGDQVPPGRAPGAVDAQEHGHGHHHAHDHRSRMPASVTPRDHGAGPGRTAHRPVAEINRLIDGSVAVARGEGPRDRAVPPAGRGRGGDPPDAGRAGPPARGRRARLDHRHRRGGVRARVVRRRPRSSRRR